MEITSHRLVVRRVTRVAESGTPALDELIAEGAAQGDGNKPQGPHIVLSKGGTPVPASCWTIADNTQLILFV